MSTLFKSAPYQNLTLTGPIGVGKSSVGRAVAARLGATFFDVENEIMAREGQSADRIREMFGESRLRTLEVETIHDLALNRHALIVVSGAAILDTTNRTRLAECGPILCLTCALNDILRRMHAARGAWFHNPSNRGVMLSRLKREWRVTTIDLPRLDTTRLTAEEAASAVIDFWFANAHI